MLGRRHPQRSLFEAQAWPHRVPADSFYARLGAVMEQLFRDPHSPCSPVACGSRCGRWGKCDDLAELYCLDNGRPSLPPSLTRTRPARLSPAAPGAGDGASVSGILLLQFYDDVSDAEATRT